MKRILALLLALSMLFALCACGSKELSAGEKEKIYQKNAAEKAAEAEEEETAEETAAEKNNGYQISDFYGVWKTSASDNTIEIGEDFSRGNSFIFRNGRGSSSTLYGMEIDGNSIVNYSPLASAEWIASVKASSAYIELFIEEVDGELQLRYQNNVYVRDADTSAVSNIVEANDYFKLDAICVDDSYRAEKSDALRQVYLFFTVTANNKNLKVNSRDIFLKINGVNEYQSYRIPFGRENFPNYSHSVSAEDVYIGESLKVFTTFEIPKGDLEPGRTITLRDSSIPEISGITFSTDLIQHFNGVEEIAMGVDPEGFEKHIHMQEEANPETQRAVNNYIVGRTYWAAIGNSTSSVSFRSGNKCELRMASITTDASYSVRNGYIFIHTIHTPEKPFIKIPYTMDENGVVDMDFYGTFMR